jgi:hypothetical protein
MLHSEREKASLGRRVTRAIAALSAVLVILAAGGCTRSRQAAATAPVRVVGVSAYRLMLSTVVVSLASDLQRLRTAQAPAAVSSAAAAAEHDVAGDIRTLQGSRGPASAQAAQAALIAALRQYATSLGSIGAAAGSDQVCAGYSAAALLSRSTGAARLRQAQAGAGMPQFLPPPTAATDRRLANGTLIMAPVPRGLGELTIINTAGTTDAVVGMVLGGRTAMAVYVQAGATRTVRHIGDGVYQVYVTTGADWDAAGRLFTRGCGFEKMNTTFDYVTTTHGNATQYAADQITLTPAADGNVTLSNVPADQFPPPLSPQAQNGPL